MLESIATECRRWTAGLPVEIVLVFPVLRGVPAAPVAIERGATSSIAMPIGRVLRAALATGAVQIVVAHNHPSGSAPGAADLAVTRRLVAAGATVGITLRAHLVVSTAGWYNCAAPTLRLNRWPDAVAA